MKIVIEINMDNDAFASGKKAETKRIIKELFDNVRFSAILKNGPMPLLDINGNSVGYAKIEGN